MALSDPLRHRLRLAFEGSEVGGRTRQLDRLGGEAQVVDGLDGAGVGEAAGQSVPRLVLHHVLEEVEEEADEPGEEAEKEVGGAEADPVELHVDPGVAERGRDRGVALDLELDPDPEALDADLEEASPTRKERHADPRPNVQAPPPARGQFEDRRHGPGPVDGPFESELGRLPEVEDEALDPAHPVVTLDQTPAGLLEPQTNLYLPGAPDLGEVAVVGCESLVGLGASGEPRKRPRRPLSPIHLGPSLADPRAPGSAFAIRAPLSPSMTQTRKGVKAWETIHLMFSIYDLLKSKIRGYAPMRFATEALGS